MLDYCWFPADKRIFDKTDPCCCVKGFIFVDSQIQKKFYGKPSTKSWKYLQIPCSDALPLSHREHGLL